MMNKYPIKISTIIVSNLFLKSLFILSSLELIFMSYAGAEERKIGLWIEAEGEVRPLSDKKEFKKLLDTLSKSKFTDLYVQIYRHNRSWFPSKVSDSTPYYENRRKGFYPINKLISFSKKRGIKVHAWINALRVGENTSTPILEKVGEEGTLYDSKGTSLYSTKGEGAVGCRPDTPGIWLDPSNEEVRNTLVTVSKELTTRYPGLSGIHLDMIRTTFPYSENETTLCKQFLTKSELEEAKLLRSSLNEAEFKSELKQEDTSDFKRQAVTDIVRHIRRNLDMTAPQIELSAAVLANYTKAKCHASQDWKAWLDQGLVDNVVTMNYTTQIDRFSREFSPISEYGKKANVGVGAWLSLGDKNILIEQVKKVKATESTKGSHGIVLFSYANLANPKGLSLLKSFFEEF